MRGMSGTVGCYVQALAGGGGKGSRKDYGDGVHGDYDAEELGIEANQRVRRPEAPHVILGMRCP